ncbi:Similar to EIF4G3: Eukaryotic translation initiation factor 4 gamma 3 (Homo sapiens) [Cotesia congregata]|uniref:Similar to EIF4G3: Eukaryotic translation initiation factor 4 gamma 3 (Homo sapiens) n=1 Tax=Cotesia congregata TaxID=51543 RepID=A0A8J2MU56_COTCN|nr:Similar to EIF4G3: Eukaryotic translation initiation factor 4 gamma 3 (Homo sapiens) [Cotesia congregata]
MTVLSVNNLKINGESNNNKQYDRDFLIKLRDIPQCKIKPAYLNNRFESIHKSEFRLRESDNAWKPTLLKKKTGAEVEEETQVLYKNVRSVLNKLTPEKFDKLVGQVRALEIDSQEKLQGVINLVFDKAIDEPNFAVAYVLMCKELALMKVNTPNEKKPSQVTGNPAANVNFRKLLITRCQVEFEKNKTNETQRTEKVKEIEECKDAKRKKDLQADLEDYDRKIRMKSVGNIKFIGELYKQRMLTSNIMNLCINHLLQTPDEENLECLCKLLTTIGKIFEEKNDLSSYFKKLTELTNQKGVNKISSRIRFMIQDIIDLKANKWVPRHVDNNPKTIIDEITLGSKNSYTWKPLVPPAPAILSPNKFSILDAKLEEQNSIRRSYAGSRSTGFSERSNDRSFQRDNNNSQQRRVPLFEQRLAMLRNAQSGNILPAIPAEKISSSTSVPSQVCVNKSLKSDVIKSLLKSCENFASTEEFIKAAEETIADNFDSSSYEFFVSEAMNCVLEKSKTVRQRFSALLSQMMEKNIISLCLFQKEFKKLLEIKEDLVIDIPNCQTYLVEILSGLLTSGAHSFVELKQTLAVLKSTGCGKFLEELLSTVAKDQKHEWVAGEWKKSGLTWSDLVDTQKESVDEIIKNYSLEFLTGDSATIKKSSQTDNCYFEKTFSQLLDCMGKSSVIDFITNFITTKFGEQPAGRQVFLKKKTMPGQEGSEMVHVSLSLNESVKLHESVNPWKPTLLKKKTGAQMEDETQVLYKNVLRILNKLTLEKFYKLVGQLRALEIDTQEKLQGVIDLVFDKTINEPNFAVVYALMCKELGLIRVNTSNEKNSSQVTENPDANVNFRKLLLNRCQMEFEKNKTNDTQRTEKVKKIEECNDAKRKKDLQADLAEYDRKIRIKSVGNIKFMGELYKQRMLTSNIMNKCINHLLQTPDEENIERLCKLLTTIGKIFEIKNDLSFYFKKLPELTNQKGVNKISSRIRFMIQDIIDLRANKWVPRHVDNNPKTISQIQKEVETEQFINTHLNASYNPSQNSRSDNKPRRHETVLSNKNSYMWNQPAPAILSSNKFSILGAKLEEQISRRRSNVGSQSTGFSERSNDEYIQTSISNSQQRNRVPLVEQTSTSVSSQVCMNKSLKCEVIKSLLNTCENFASTEEFIKAAEETIAYDFDSSSYEFFVSEAINCVLEKSKTVRKRFSALLSYMMEKNIICLCLFQREFKKLLEIKEDLVIDIPNCQTYLVEILSGLLISGAHPFVELKKTLAVLKSTGCGKFLGELLSTVAKDQKHEWVAGEWKKSGLTWSDLVDTQKESVDEIIKNYSLEFLTGDSATIKKSSQTDNCYFDKTFNHLLACMRQSSVIDFITSFITQD